MMTFITFASYSQSGAAGMLAKPSDRAEVIGPLIEKAGGRMIALYMVTGANDVVVISEAPNGDAAVALSLAVSASGALSKCETVRAWSSAEFVDIAKKAGELAGAYSTPGS